MKTIKQEDFIGALFSVLNETFEGLDREKGNVYLDRGMGFFNTIENIDAKTASRSVIIDSPTLAGHCEHARFYLEFLNNYLNNNLKMADWRDSWRVTIVDEAEWNALKLNLRSAFKNVSETFTKIEIWDESSICGALGIITHTAYHLCAVRQMSKLLLRNKGVGNGNGKH